MNKKGTKQVNNMKIKWSNIYEKWQVIAPGISGARVLEEFSKFENAVKCAKSIKDFVRC